MLPFYSYVRWWQLIEWVANGQLVLDNQTVLHILGYDGATIIFKGCGQDKRIIKLEAVLVLQTYSHQLGINCKINNPK